VIHVAREALDDLDRIIDFNEATQPGTARRHLALIREAVLVLERHPDIGRPIGRGETLRELVISRGATGYVALYEHAPAMGIVRVVAIRHQREAGFRES